VGNHRPQEKGTVMATRFVVAALAVLACAPPAGAALPSAAKLRHEVAGLVAAGVPGAVVVVRDGRKAVRVAGGSARLGPRQAMRVDDRFRIGSLTKTYVATVVLQLAGEGKLTLEDSIERWLPGMVPNGANITLRELLNHHSGVFDYLEDPQVVAPYLAGDFGHTWTPQQLVSVGVAHPPVFAPNAQFGYSNTDYVLLGLVIQTVTGRAVGRELNGRIFQPLKLRATSFPSGQRIRGAHAHGYLVTGARSLRDVTAVSPTHGWAAGAIVSTADDVARFYRALFSGRLLRPDLLAAMQTPTDRWGLGLEQFADPCATPWGHGGAFPGYNAIARNSANGRRQMVVLVNSESLSSGVGGDQAEEAFDRLTTTANGCA
jgi:D-alanyl-D-alanine carboxypeptidase